jgi:hypothetical protein
VFTAWRNNPKAWERGYKKYLEEKEENVEKIKMKESV